MEIFRDHRLPIRAEIDVRRFAGSFWAMTNSEYLSLAMGS